MLVFFFLEADAGVISPVSGFQTSALPVARNVKSQDSP